MLQLEVFVNERPTALVAAFTQRQNGKLACSETELDEIGLLVPKILAKQNVDIPLDDLPGITYRYDEVTQTIRFTAESAAQKPTHIGGQAMPPVPLDPVRPPLGALVNYTLFANGGNELDGPRLGGLAGTFETRAFGSFGLIENSFIRQFYDNPDMVRLDSSYSYQEPGQLKTWQVGDFISGGFSWTRPIRMAGIQIRRSFGLRPDLVTMPLPTLSGSAAAPSTLDLYINNVRTLSTIVPQGPYEVDHPPIISGGGQAQLILRDVMGRETISTTPFYVSPDLLAAGLNDFSVESGFARRNYATISNDYEERPAFSGSYRYGATPFTTLQAHAESVEGLVDAGGGGIFSVGGIGVGSVAVSGSRTAGQEGALFDSSFESLMPYFSLTLRSQRTVGDYEDLASWTAVVPSNTPGGRRVFGNPRELNQATVALPLSRSESSISMSYIQINEDDGMRSKIANLSFTQGMGHVTMFASAITDLAVRGSATVFGGLSIPLGSEIAASTGATYGDSEKAEYIEVSKQGGQDPGTFGGSMHISDNDQQRETEGILRYGTSFARFEVSGDHNDSITTETALMEGALTLVGGEVYATPRLDNAFALVETGAPGVTILSENRKVGVTDSDGNLLVTNLEPFVSNRIALDPAGLPVDARISATEAIATPFSKVPSRVDLRVDTDTRSVLLTLIDPGKQPIEIGSRVQIEGRDQNQDFVVGYDGQAYLDGLTDENTLLVKTPDGGTCRAQFHYQAALGEQVHINAVVCMPLVPQ